MKNWKIIKITLVITILLFFSCEDEFDYGKILNAVKTTEFNNVTQTTASVSGNVITDNGRSLSSRGVCYSTSNNPTINDQKVVFSTATLGNYSCNIINLAPNTTYFARAYATNSYGTAYGNPVSFKTLQATVPVITSTTSASSITQTTALSGGVISNSGASTITSRGVCYSSSNNIPTITDPKTTNGTGIGTFTSPLTGLTVNTTYYIRAYATNGIGTAYGDVKTFNTSEATIPTGITTTTISTITQTSASSGGSITNDGGASITSKGVCWSNTTSSPTIANTKTIDGTGIGTFSSSLTSLTPGTTYYVRAYATNSVGTAYGTTRTFTATAATIPTGITTNIVSSITQNTALSGGNVSSDGGASITSRGVCWSNTNSNPTINNTKTIDGTGIGAFSSSLTNLTPGTTYYVRAYATNSVGTAYGTTRTFTTTSATIPAGITTNIVSSISLNSALSGGNVSSDGGASITSRGVCWSNTNSNPTINNTKTIDGSGEGSFSSSLTNLSPGTTYYVRAYATNSVGTAYGTTRTFTTTSATIPTGITTNTVSSITLNSALSGGNVSSDGGASITSKGVCWSNTNSNPTINNSITSNGFGIGSFSSSLTGLQSNTTYYVRAYATNAMGTAYGTTRTFTTSGASLPSGITTTSVTSITQTSASSGGSITNDGGASITSRGVCWSNTNSNPTINNSTTSNGSGTGSFSSSLTNLTPGTTYYVRAYATNSVGTAYGTTRTFTTTANLSVGQSYQGGIIAYIFVSGDSGYIAGQTHGLIATTSNQSTGAQWGCSGTSISGTSTALGSGQTNTTAIVNGCSSTTNAAAICNNLTSGGYSDWYLPSREELTKLYSNKALIGGFVNTNYWSSSQSTSTTASIINFSTGASSTSTKTTSRYVRAIRKF